MHWGSHYLGFLAENAEGIDLLVPLTGKDEPSNLAGTTLFVFFPERMNGVSIVQTWFPRGVLNDRSIEPYGLVYATITVLADD